MNISDFRDPLVTILVISYNSSNYITETLESVKLQSYKNLELIISDDCSTDSTVDICTNWLKQNNERFYDTRIVKSAKNTGTSANCNRGISYSKGIWIKYIAADDVLLSNCISENIKFIQSNIGVDFLFTDFICINEDSKVIERDFTKNCKIPSNIFNGTPYVQYKNLILDGNLWPAPTSFINKSTLIEVGGFDESIPLIEDEVLWIRATKQNFKLYYNPIQTVAYRKHSDSIQLTKNAKKSNLYFKCSIKVFVKYRLAFGLTHNIFKTYDKFLQVVMIRYNNMIMRIIRLSSPHYYYMHFAKVLKKIMITFR